MTSPAPAGHALRQTDAPSRKADTSVSPMRTLQPWYMVKLRVGSMKAGLHSVLWDGMGWNKARSGRRLIGNRWTDPRHITASPGGPPPARHRPLT